MPSSKEAVILVVITFLVVILIYSSVAKFGAFARSSIISTGCTKRDPTKTGATSAKECCWGVTVTDKSGRITDVYSLCQTCEYDSNGNKIDCRDTSPSRSTGGRSTGNAPPTSVAPPTNVLPPPSQTCPGGSALDANGNCPTTKTNEQVAPQQLTKCPDGSAPDANGNCPPTTIQKTQAPTSSGTDNQGQLNSNSNNNPPSDHHKSKHSDDSGSNNNK